jgi:replicative DNA helicase
VQNSESATTSLVDTAPAFEKYAEEFEKNTIYSGIPALDEKCRFLVGTSSGILGAPSSGKSSLMLQILNHNSLIGNDCLFFSLDMYYSSVYTSLARRHSYEIGNKILTEDDIFHAFKNKTPLKTKILDTFKKNYANVQFCFKSGISVEDLANTIKDTEEKVGRKMRLVVIDYSQLVFTNLSDPTASSALVANTLRKVANDCNVAMLTLFQPNKMNADPRKEITQYTAAKGSGSIAESMQLFLTMNRPGWSNQHPETDKFASINAVKNRSGPLFRVDMGWEGATGSFRDLEPEEYAELKQLREAVAAEYANKEAF